VKTEVTLPSGSKLGLQIASFSDAGLLRRVLARELKTVRVEISPDLLPAIVSGDRKLILAAFGANDVNFLWSIFLQVLGSEELELAVFECMKSCVLARAGTGPAVKILPETFRSEEAREDFLPCAWEVMKFNLRPFFSRLWVSKSSDPSGGETSVAQK
jgi:hypothetical protein